MFLRRVNTVWKHGACMHVSIQILNKLVRYVRIALQTMKREVETRAQKKIRCGKELALFDLDVSPSSTRGWGRTTRCARCGYWKFCIQVCNPRTPTIVAWLLNDFSLERTPGGEQHLTCALSEVLPYSLRFGDGSTAHLNRYGGRRSDGSFTCFSFQSTRVCFECPTLQVSHARVFFSSWSRRRRGDFIRCGTFCGKCSKIERILQKHRPCVPGCHYRNQSPVLTVSIRFHSIYCSSTSRPHCQEYQPSHHSFLVIHVRGDYVVSLLQNSHLNRCVSPADQQILRMAAL